MGKFILNSVELRVEFSQFESKILPISFDEELELLYDYI